MFQSCLAHLVEFISYSLFNSIAVDIGATKRSFNFPKKHKMPFYFVSASDGTNVVKVKLFCVVKWSNLSLSFPLYVLLLLFFFALGVLLVYVICDSAVLQRRNTSGGGVQIKLHRLHG